MFTNRHILIQKKEAQMHGSCSPWQSSTFRGAMGNASRWLRSLFTLKKKEKDEHTAAAPVPAGKEKRRWSFRYWNSRNNEDASAVKIQTIFRSYLARKALRALKGLVILQALVRGQLVRKRAAAALRSMEVLAAAQARARGRRIQMLEEVQQRDGRRSSASNTDLGETLLTSTAQECEDLSSSCRHETAKSSSSSSMSYMAATESSRLKARSWRPKNAVERRRLPSVEGGRRPRELARVQLDRSNASS